MSVLKRISKQRARRSFRVRNRVRRDSNTRARLTVFRSGKHIYAQIVDDSTGKTLVSASSLQAGTASTNGGNKDAAKRVGLLIAERALAGGVEKVVFDRGVYKYHGRVAALADSAREGGLNF